MPEFSDCVKHSLLSQMNEAITLDNRESRTNKKKCRCISYNTP